MNGGVSAATFGEVELTPGCALALAWPAQVLRDFAREDLAMIGFQAWLLGMSVVAVSLVWLACFLIQVIHSRTSVDFE